MKKSEIRNLVKEVINERWLDFLKSKPEQSPSTSKYTNPKKWAKDNLDNDGAYVGEDLNTNYDFPLKIGDIIPEDDIPKVMELWNIAKALSINAYVDDLDSNKLWDAPDYSVARKDVKSRMDRGRSQYDVN